MKIVWDGIMKAGWSNIYCNREGSREKRFIFPSLSNLGNVFFERRDDDDNEFQHCKNYDYFPGHGESSKDQPHNFVLQMPNKPTVL